MTELATNPHTIVKQRAANLDKVMDGYEIRGRPGLVGARGMISHPRLALITQYGDKGNYRVHLAEDRGAVESLAAYLALGDEAIVCYFDLDELDGDEYPLLEGDRVRYEGDEFVICASSDNLVDGVVCWQYWLNKTGEYELSEADHYEVDQDDLELIARGEDFEDERMPVRYGLAKVVVSVVFNTVPSP